METHNSNGDSATSVFGYQYQDGVVPTRVHAYDLKYEHEAQKTILLEMEKKDREEHAAVVEDGATGYLFGDGSEGPSVGIEEGPFAYDIEYELKMQSEIVWKGNGHFTERKWLFTDVNGNIVSAPVEISPERPLIVHTTKRSSTPGGLSYAHEEHPFIAFVHLLKSADVGSTVFITMPYLTDFYVLDELCHYAATEEEGGRNLTIKAIIGYNKDALDTINSFIGVSAKRQAGINRLHLRYQGSGCPFIHTKGMASTAGCMVGSYNFTTAACEKNIEQGVLLAAGAQSDKVRIQLEAQWLACPAMQKRTSNQQQGTKRKAT
jgi:hypothetical protein